MDKFKTIDVQILNAFVDNDRGGNPAGVVLNSDELSDKNKLEIAKKVGLSETAFVSNSKKSDFKLDFFTPTRQIAHCGHATIATFSYLRQIGVLKNDNTSKETIEGERKIKMVGDLAFMEQLAPSYTDLGNQAHLVLKSLGLEKIDLMPNAPIKVVNTGNSFLLIPVNHREILKNLVPNLSLIEEISEKLDLIGYYVFTTDTNSPEGDAASRMFGPRYGISEEAGTGMAAGPLACYLHDILEMKKKTFSIHQGEYMKKPSPSHIIVKLHIESGAIKSLMAGGKGLLKSQIKVAITL